MKQLAPGSRLVVASHNPGKTWEIKQLIAPYGFDAVSAGDLGLAEPEETEPTFDGNARLKALAAAEASGLPALADDSGLEVEALDGAPGIYSARWAGPGKDFALAMRRVHDALEEKGAWNGPPPRANFISVLCLAWPTGEHRLFEGRVYGTLVWPPRGGNGFGYDPMFVADGETLTFGEMEPASKYAISHRTRAFAAFKRDCLEEVKPAHAAAKSGRDLEALEAAARNLSTQAELARFISGLRDDFARNASAWKTADLAAFLAALEKTAAAADVPDAEPRWRTLARALLAASR
ncbi:RdgB/HAM1 family non-canonical purine NTP pyrophosphatase [Hyphomicrobium sp. LHD-15]|uniref:RdgB/HAM1 family non-canonical purine NTP pyrophosphatase n=1 Tax=Hyphomicrobium sp. LHD-15 TaxID=3072142 RepID=UPI0028103921|nr:RdgB/HAM1 family non-canonical purine NTP pyrophosphatase [Hyphomicrobium sp. LHD-15]MDQ8698926.1 RdgB/HAM1 family non-canonical purine NTP pyrophosphatase [Hyphomicrobium sp. LHD-15]